MAETSGEMRGEGERQVKSGGDGEPAHQIVESDRDRGEDRDTEQAIEMRTARDAKAVPSSGGRNDPLESHLTGEQLANLTLEDHLLLERRIKVAHTNLNQKNAQKKKRSMNVGLKKSCRCGMNPQSRRSLFQVLQARAPQPVQLCLGTLQA